jgi:hypothetical protein
MGGERSDAGERGTAPERGALVIQTNPRPGRRRGAADDTVRAAKDLIRSVGAWDDAWMGVEMLERDEPLTVLQHAVGVAEDHCPEVRSDPYGRWSCTSSMTRPALARAAIPRHALTLDPGSRRARWALCLLNDLEHHARPAVNADQQRRDTPDFPAAGALAARRRHGRSRHQPQRPTPVRRLLSGHRDLWPPSTGAQPHAGRMPPDVLRPSPLRSLRRNARSTPGGRT